MLVDVFGNVDEGQDSKHWFDVKYLTPEHVRQLDDVAPLQVKHSEWQGSHVFVDVFSKTLVATHDNGHSVPSKYLPDGQELHWFAPAPVHSAQFP